MTTIDAIVTETRARLARDPRPSALLEREARSAIGGRERGAFSRALRRSGTVKVIAEIKAASPSAGTILEDIDPVSLAQAYHRGGASALSVVTERSFFKGRHEWVAEAFEATGLPVVMKDFIVDERQILEGLASGAGAVLLLASVLDSAQLSAFIAMLSDFGADALVEAHDEKEIERAVSAGAGIIGINNRDLRDFSISLDTGERLGSSVPAGITRVAESGIRSRTDIERLQRAGFDAFLVGTSLLTSENPEEAVRSLLGSEP